MTNHDPAMPPRTRIKTINVHARNEDFRIVQLRGNLFVCSQAHGSCCCGWTDKGRAPLNLAVYEQEWEQRKIRTMIHLTFTGCLGPCAVGNNAMLQIDGQSIWFKDLNSDALIPLVFEYIEAILKAGQVVSPPAALTDHVYARYLPAHTDTVLVAGDLEDDGGGLERLDPVCLMDVDPATARYSSVYADQTIYFCAPGCKKVFDRDPQAYMRP